MNDSQDGLNNRLKAYGSSSVVAVILGVMVAFLSLTPSNFQGFVTLGLVSLIFISLGGGLGLYCWRLLYLSRKLRLSLGAYVLGLSAAFIPIAIAYKALA
jgi:hypothetical protein